MKVLSLKGRSRPLQIYEAPYDGGDGRGCDCGYADDRVVADFATFLNLKIY